MLEENINKHVYIITKPKMEEWFLYSIEHCTFGKRMIWTSDLRNALIFTSVDKAQFFKEKVFGNVPIVIRRFAKFF